MHLRTAIAGSFYREGAVPAIMRLKAKTPLRLAREPDNPHDKHAVAIYQGTQHLGYVPRAQSPLVATMIDSGWVVTCTCASTGQGVVFIEGTKLEEAFG